MQVIWQLKQCGCSCKNNDMRALVLQKRQEIIIYSSLETVNWDLSLILSNHERLFMKQFSYFMKGEVFIRLSTFLTP